MRRIFWILVAAGLAWPAAAGAQRAAITQAMWDGQGDPVLLGQGVPEGKGRVSWRVCPAEERCRRIAGGIHIAPGYTPAGTRFELTVEYRGRRTRVLSKPWRGRVRAAFPPVLNGTPSVGSIVTPSTAVWSGGWDMVGPLDSLHVEACTTPPTGCVTVAYQDSPWDEPLVGTPVTIPAFAAGRYLQVVDKPQPRDALYGGPAYLTPQAAPPLRRDPAVAVSAPVRVAPALPGTLGSPFSAAAWARGR
ncbi:hypothetical protein OJ997_30120 [Solirubrobacter phytolaccae]|uniref:Uncharacterized protein n=1 Tax=Solirubrobacter phytolaccae TaxID=1404360 RepID=A0A9X3NGD3_9ACTN|nr:hypothetical protein [Solirubrobacter phytolaccae]MDA0184597.1 hypothetical protein [Solirubrobacter phytolaccae]